MSDSMITIYAVAGEDYGDGFTIRCKQISQKEFLNLLAPEEY